MIIFTKQPWMFSPLHWPMSQAIPDWDDDGDDKYHFARGHSSFYPNQRSFPQETLLTAFKCKVSFLLPSTLS